MIKLSIIIPHYDTYDLTYKLLKELSIQVNNNVEIIVIDDSNDLRLDVFSDIAIIKHFNIKQGISRARNYGLDISKGSYISFIDSDDMITNDYIDVLLNAIDTREEDIIVFNWVDFNNNLIYRQPRNYAVWKAIYKKDIVPRFNENVEFDEDVYFQEELLKTRHSYYYIDRVLYIYNSGRVGSAMYRKLQKEE